MDSSTTGVALTGWAKQESPDRALLLKRCLRWTGGNLSEAEDLLGDACLQMIEALQRNSTNVQNARSFLFTVINNLGRDRLRRSRRWRSSGRNDDHVLDSLQAGDSNAEQLMLLRECLDATARELRQLSPNQRTALTLRSTGVEYSAIAKLLSTSETNARKLVETTRKLLARNRESQPRPAARAKHARSKVPAKI